MRCPRCPEHPLRHEELPAGPKGHRCAICGGWWVRLKAYAQWLRAYGAPRPMIAATGDHESVEEASDTARLCPECGHILRKFKVGKGFSFSLERCGACRGMWLDQGEWEALQTRNFHDEILRLLEPNWQVELLREESAKKRRSFLIEKLGEDDYLRLKEIRSWIWSHPEKSMIIGYIEAKDPGDDR